MGVNKVLTTYSKKLNLKKIKDQLFKDRQIEKSINEK